MPPNRRNHYRVLHVQPEAPDEVIKASYRTLMTRLRMHPDLGGSHEAAAMINEAYAVLSDPVRRAEYDRQLRLRFAPERMRQMNFSAPAAVSRRGAEELYACGTPVRRPTDQQAVAAGGRIVCAFCLAANPATGPQPHLCQHCGAPLTPVRVLALPNFRGGTGLNRRASVRRSRQAEAVAYWGQPPQRHRVWWRDLSANGLSVWAPSALAPGQRLHLMDAEIHTVAEVVACEASPKGWLLRARLLTLRPIKRQGLFYNGQA